MTDRNREPAGVKHGHACRGRVTTTYNSWNSMIQRCNNPKNSDYPDYGGNGIGVCQDWRESFAAFLRDMGPRPQGTSLDRIDGRRNYEPANCRWATAQEQASNRRSSWRVIRSDGKEYQSIAAAADDVWGRTRGIGDACRGRQKTHRGFGWEYMP